jgi:hypothetical protein
MATKGRSFLNEVLLLQRGDFVVRAGQRVFPITRNEWGFVRLCAHEMAREVSLHILAAGGVREAS